MTGLQIANRHARALCDTYGYTVPRGEYNLRVLLLEGFATKAEFDHALTIHGMKVAHVDSLPQRKRDSSRDQFP